MPNSPEHINHSPERRVDPQALEQAGQKQHERLRADLERRSERAPETAAESARHEALATATSIERHKTPRSEKVTEQRRGPIGKRERDASYKATMRRVESQLSPTSRTFSRVIHAKAVERTSEVVGTTIARPNAILAGAVAAFIVTLGTYLVAKRMGYALSGFETIGAMIFGWVIGLVYDFLRVMITGRR